MFLISTIFTCFHNVFVLCIMFDYNLWYVDLRYKRMECLLRVCSVDSIMFQWLDANTPQELIGLSKLWTGLQRKPLTG